MNWTELNCQLFGNEKSASLSEIWEVSVDNATPVFYSAASLSSYVMQQVRIFVQWAVRINTVYTVSVQWKMDFTVNEV